MAADPAEDMVLVLNGERYVPTGITVIFVGVAGKDTVKQTIKAPTMINHDFGAITITAVVQTLTYLFLRHEQEISQRMR